MQNSLYHILKVTPTASQAEIARSYKMLALKLHPDRNPDDKKSEELFKEVASAYAILSDEDKRAEYDSWISQRYSAAQQQEQEFEARQAFIRRRKRQQREAHERAQKDEKRAFVAVGVFLVLAFMATLGGRYTLQWMHDREISQVQAAQEKLYKQAYTFRRGHDDIGLLDFLQEHPTVIANFGETNSWRKDALERLSDRFAQAYNRQDYQSALHFASLLEEHNYTFTTSQLVHLSDAYQQTSQYLAAEEMLTKALENGILYTEIAPRLARLQREQLKKPEMADRVIEQAANSIIDAFKTVHGDAYLLFLQPANVSDSQYNVFMERAATKLALGKIADAQAAYKWVIFLRPEAAEAHLGYGNMSLEKQDFAAACKSWQRAKTLGSNQAADQLKKYCR